MGKREKKAGSQATKHGTELLQTHFYGGSYSLLALNLSTLKSFPAKLK
jgi:hypothetical protein